MGLLRDRIGRRGRRFLDLIDDGLDLLVGIVLRLVHAAVDDAAGEAIGEAVALVGGAEAGKVGAQRPGAQAEGDNQRQQQPRRAEGQRAAQQRRPAALGMTEDEDEHHQDQRHRHKQKHHLDRRKILSDQRHRRPQHPDVHSGDRRDAEAEHNAVRRSEGEPEGADHGVPEGAPRQQQRGGKRQQHNQRADEKRAGVGRHKGETRERGAARQHLQQQIDGQCQQTDGGHGMALVPVGPAAGIAD